MPIFMLLRQAFLWGIGAQLGARLTEATLNRIGVLSQETSRKNIEAESYSKKV